MKREEIKAAAERYIVAERVESFRKEVADLLAAEKWDELEDRFYTDLEFGTGGLRGVIGGGINRMNPYVIQRATTGLARYVAAHGDGAPDGKKSAVIAHDSRRYSREFAKAAALVFAAHGIKAYLFPDLRPTPELSFAVRRLGASTGIVITASHNPPEYNGYKVSWSDGAQIVAPHDKAIIKEVQGVGEEVKSVDEDQAVREGLLEYLGTEMDDAFIAMAKRQSVRPELLKERGGDVKVVYTPLHGTGAMMVERLLGELGVEVVTVPEQREPDGEFPTVEFPNPEEASALEMALELGRKENADIVIGTDPDADRIGIAVPDEKDFRLITGNQLAALLVDYIFSSRSELGTLPEKPVLVSTVVTSQLQRVVAERYGGVYYETLTGFKNIAAVMREIEKDPSRGQFVIGDEESYGYLIGTEVRDKDSITATLLTIEMALYHRSKGRTVLDRLNELYREYGYYEELAISKYFRGQAGKEIMNTMMSDFRRNTPSEFGGSRVLRVVDLLEDTEMDVASGKTKAGPGLPKSNVLQLFLENEGKVSMRPSGTEPKIKFYASCHGKPGENLDDAKQKVKKQLAAIESDVIKLIEKAEG